MDQKYKTLIPLIIIFFIFGIVVGYVAHKPETIVKTVEVEKIVTVTVTVTPTPTPATPAPTPTPTPTAAPAVADFTVKDYYNPFIDIPTYTIQLRNWGADPRTLAIRQGESVEIKNTDGSLTSPMTLILNSHERYIGKYGGSAFVTFNKKGTYTLKAILLSEDPTITSKTYAEGVINVY